MARCVVQAGGRPACTCAVRRREVQQEACMACVRRQAVRGAVEVCEACDDSGAY